jgi:hypothetical protein
LKILAFHFKNSQKGLVVLLIEVFEENSLFCKVCIEGSNKWLDGVLIHVNAEKNLADIFLSVRHFRSLFSEGDVILVKSIDSDQEYSIKGILSKKIVSMRRQSITLQILEMKEFQNYRHAERFQVNYPAIIQPISSQVNSSGILIDISSGGVLMVSPSSYEINTALNIEIFSAADGNISFVARILRKTKNNIGYTYGMILEEIDHPNALMLNKLIQSLMEEKKSILEEFHRFKRIKSMLYIFMMLILVVIVVYLVKLI